MMFCEFRKVGFPWHCFAHFGFAGKLQRRLVKFGGSNYSAGEADEILELHKRPSDMNCALRQVIIQVD